MRHDALNYLISVLFEQRLPRLQRKDSCLTRYSLLKTSICTAKFSVMHIIPFSFPVSKKSKYRPCESSPIYSSRVSSYVRLKLWQRILRKLAIASFITLLANNMELFSATQVSWSILKELKVFRPLQPSSLSFNILMLVELALSVMGDYFIYEVEGLY